MNWGNKLLLTFIVFVGGMAYLIYRSVGTHYELVEKDYYKQELRYQEVIDGAKSASSLASPVTMEQTKEGIFLQLPAEMKNKSLTGKVWFYCAYDAGRDKKFDLRIDNSGIQSFAAGVVAPGYYTVRINWNDAGKNYYAEKPLTVL